MVVREHLPNLLNGQIVEKLYGYRLRLLIENTHFVNLPKILGEKTIDVLFTNLGKELARLEKQNKEKASKVYVEACPYKGYITPGASFICRACITYFSQAYNIEKAEHQLDGDLCTINGG